MESENEQISHYLSNSHGYKLSLSLSLSLSVSENTHTHTQSKRHDKEDDNDDYDGKQLQESAVILSGAQGLVRLLLAVLEPRPYGCARRSPPRSMACTCFVRGCAGTVGLLVDSEIVLSTRYGKARVFINRTLSKRPLTT
jgi:hypothetical protein